MKERREEWLVYPFLLLGKGKAESVIGQETNYPFSFILLRNFHFLEDII